MVWLYLMCFATESQLTQLIKKSRLPLLGGSWLD
jgi:hypothetical protein